MGEEAGDYVGDEDGAERQQEVLDMAEVLAQDENRDPGRRQRPRSSACRRRQSRQ